MGTIPRIAPSLIATAQLNRLLPTGIGAPTTTSCARPAVARAIRLIGPKPGVQQRRLAEQIGAGVAGDAQLRERARYRCRQQRSRTRMISAALAAGSATAVRGETQEIRTNPYWFM